MFSPTCIYGFCRPSPLIFAALVVLERVGALATFRRFAATLVCAMAAGAIIGGIAYESLFSHENAIYLLPFFLLGLGANRFREVLLRPAVAWACALVFVIAAAFHSNLVLEVGAVTPTLIVLVIGFSGVMALIYFTPRWRPLERLGAYSFTIYLLHPFAVAPSRKILQALNLDPAVVLFGVGLVVGVLAPIVFEHLARRVPIARRCYWDRVGIPQRGHEFRCRRRTERARVRPGERGQRRPHADDLR